MTVEDYRKYQVWQDAIKLSTQVHGLIESLPDDERGSLGVSLNQAAIAVPSGIAVNLANHQSADLAPIIGLLNQLELVNRVYPALDTVGIETQARTVLTKLSDETGFNQPIPEPAKPEPVVEEFAPDAVDADEPEPEDDDESDEASEPAKVQVVPES